MKLEMSNCIAFETSRPEQAVAFYQKIFGMHPTKQTADFTEFKNEHVQFYITKENKCPGVMLDFKVDNQLEAIEHLKKNGCEIVQWNGAGSDCFMRDPFGLVFNLWEKK